MRRRKPPAGFIFMDVMERILENPKIPREALRVLGVLIGHVDWRNRVRLKVKEMAAKLDIAPQNASRGLQALREQGVVTMLQQGEYEVHPELLHIGSLQGAKRRKQARVARDLADGWARESDEATP